jgi:hypothetical protein
MDKKPLIQSDFMEIQQKAMGIPEVKTYLESNSVIMGDRMLGERLELGLSQTRYAHLRGMTKEQVATIEAGFDRLN